MNYVKKMCILRQVKQGFSGDGKALSGLIKAEQYGKNLAVEVSIINFAPLVSGDYYCLLSDGKGRTETLALRGKSLFNILSDLDISNGFCGVVCYVKNEIVPIAYGINGNGAYDWRAILNATMPPIFSQKYDETATAQPCDVSYDDSMQNATTQYESAPPYANEISPQNKEQNKAQNEHEFLTEDPPQTENDQNATDGYNDETVVTENYYEEKEDGQILPDQAGGNAHVKGATEKQNEEVGLDFTQNGNAENVLHPFTTDGEGYYRSVKSELDELLQAYPSDDTLKGAFSCSEWVRIKGTQQAPEYLVGVVYAEGKAKYVCYALAAKDADNPPEEIRDVCTFVPSSVFDDTAGFFVIFQSAATGECIKPQKA